MAKESRFLSSLGRIATFDDVKNWIAAPRVLANRAGFISWGVWLNQMEFCLIKWSLKLLKKNSTLIFFRAFAFLWRSPVCKNKTDCYYLWSQPLAQLCLHHLDLQWKIMNGVNSVVRSITTARLQALLCWNSHCDLQCLPGYSKVAGMYLRTCSSFPFPLYSSLESRRPLKAIFASKGVRPSSFQSSRANIWSTGQI